MLAAAVLIRAAETGGFEGVPLAPAEPPVPLPELPVPPELGGLLGGLPDIVGMFSVAKEQLATVPI